MNPIEEKCTNADEEPETTRYPVVHLGIGDDETGRWLDDGGAVRPDD